MTRATTLAAVLAAPGAPPPGLGKVAEATLVDAWQPLETVTGEVRWVGRIMGDLPASAGRASADDLEALWARARLGGSGARTGAGRPTRILAPLTSLLVLERDADYERWGLSVPATPSSWWSPRKRVADRPAPGAKAADFDERIPEWMKRKGQADSRSTGARRDGLVGLRGRADAPDPRLARQLAEDAARRGSVLGIFGNQSGARGSDVASIFGRDSALGNDAVNARGALLGDPIAESYGIGGLGSLGTIGRGGGGGGGSGSAPGSAAGQSGPSRRVARSPSIVMGQPMVMGSLDKEIIRRVIRAHMNEVRACYEQGLRRQPTLAGRVVVRFTISSIGTVSGATVQSSTLGNAQVEQCIVRTVERWRFPSAKGGGIVIVSYPFTLAPAGRALEPAARGPTGPWDLALSMIRDAGKPVAWRVARTAEILGAPATEQPLILGWWIVADRLRPTIWPAEAHLVAAHLLRLGGNSRDALRVLSEVAPRDPPLVTAEMQRAGASKDSHRLTVLEARALLRH